MLTPVDGLLGRVLRRSNNRSTDQQGRAQNRACDSIDTVFPSVYRLSVVGFGVPTGKS